MHGKSGNERKKEMNEESNSNSNNNAQIRLPESIGEYCQSGLESTYTRFVRMRRFGRKYLKRKLLSLDPTIVPATNKQTNKN